MLLLYLFLFHHPRHGFPGGELTFNQNQKMLPMKGLPLTKQNIMYLVLLLILIRVPDQQIRITISDPLYLAGPPAPIPSTQGVAVPPFPWGGGLPPQRAAVPPYPRGGGGHLYPRAAVPLPKGGGRSLYQGGSPHTHGLAAPIPTGRWQSPRVGHRVLFHSEGIVL